MKMREAKPKLKACDLIEKLAEEKGIKFDLITKEQAELFLKERNNYMRVASYRKNYEKYKGKYLNLDFKYLVELSTLDMYLRAIILKMCINIEHSLKVQILKDIEENDNENGYDIVDEFLNIQSNAYIISNIERKSKSSYSGKLIQHYFSYETIFDDEGTVKRKFDCPVWCLMDVISFGDFISFYLFYNANYREVENFIPRNIINSVKSLRNACAHNNCILHNLHKNANSTQAPAEIAKFIAQNKNIGKDSRRNKLANQFVLEFVSLVYVYDKVVSKDIKEKTFEELHEFMFGRFVKNIAYFEKQSLVKSTIQFLQKVIDFF